MPHNGGHHGGTWGRSPCFCSLVLGWKSTLPRLSSLSLSLFSTSSRNSTVSTHSDALAHACPFSLFSACWKSILLGQHRENKLGTWQSTCHPSIQKAKAGRLLGVEASLGYYTGGPCHKENKTEKELNLKQTDPVPSALRLPVPSQFFFHPKSVCVCACAYGRQRRMAGIQLYHSLSYSTDSGYLTELGRQAGSQQAPVSSCVTILAFHVGAGDVST